LTLVGVSARLFLALPLFTAAVKYNIALAFFRGYLIQKALLRFLISEKKTWPRTFLHIGKHFVFMHQNSSMSEIAFMDVCQKWIRTGWKTEMTKVEQ